MDYREKYETNGKFDISKMKYPQYLVSNCFRTYTVAGPIGGTTEFMTGRGYIDDDGCIYIYRSSIPKKPSSREPEFWKDIHGKLYLNKLSQRVMDAFSYVNMGDYDIDTIRQVTKANEILYDEKALSDLNAAGSIFKPVINVEDDFLKKLVKLVILDKEVNIARYKGHMGKNYAIPNMRTALENKTKMSVPFFNTWAELLGFDFTITVRDSKTDFVSPLKKGITYTSLWDTFTYEDGTPVVYKLSSLEKENKPGEE